MLGIVFTEFFGMVETAYSADLLDDIIDDAGVDGAYTAVGNYPHRDLAALLGALGQRTGEPVALLLERFGRHLFGRFCRRYPTLIGGLGNCLDFLEGVEKTIHVEVRKLYPCAELPRFENERLSPDCLRMTYRSQRCLAPLALGLIHGCAAHFGETVAVEVGDALAGATVTFTITRLDRR